jgi:flagellar basal-body rod modification protein FlgD
MNLHGISTLTPLANTVAANTKAAATTSGNSTPSTPSEATQAQNTFISLLVAELKAQDPTQPMSPTDMVAQMFSMNQLQQLIGINQTLTNAFGPLTTGGK